MIWTEIEGFPGYEVNRESQVRSSKRNGIVKILKPAVSGCGYLNVVLMKNNKRHALKIHRIVGLAFIPVIPGKCFINHKNGNKLDNSIENLEWVNRSENVRHAISTGLIPASTGYSGRLDDCQILTLATIPKTTKNGTGSGFTNREISKKWGIAESLISNIRNGKISMGKYQELFNGRL